MSNNMENQEEQNGNLVEQQKSLNEVKRRRRKRKYAFDETNLTEEEIRKRRRMADAERKRARRKQMTPEEREAFLRKENERKRLQRLQPSFDPQRAKENTRKKMKRAAMSEEERLAFRKKDAERKRRERRMQAEAKKLGAATSKESKTDKEKVSVVENGVDLPKRKRGRPPKNKLCNEEKLEKPTQLEDKKVETPKDMIDKLLEEDLNCLFADSDIVKQDTASLDSLLSSLDTEEIILKPQELDQLYEDAIPEKLLNDVPADLIIPTNDTCPYIILSSEELEQLPELLNKTPIVKSSSITTSKIILNILKNI